MTLEQRRKNGRGGKKENKVFKLQVSDLMLH